MPFVTARSIWRVSSAGLIGWLFVAGIASADTDVELDARIKLFGSAAVLPADDIQRLTGGTPAVDGSGDLRSMLSVKSSRPVGLLTLDIDHSLTWLAGDSLGFAALNPLDQVVTNDDRRALDLTFRIDEGDRHQAIHRLDRASIGLRKDNWGVTLGRQALSMGSGIVFQPLDLFSPFAPTAVDRDYKNGDDLLLFEQLFSNGSDLTLLSVARRDSDGDLTARASSMAGRWRGFVGSTELEVIAGRHTGEAVVGGSIRVPIGGALARLDVLVTRLGEMDSTGLGLMRDAGDFVVTAVANLDYSFDLSGRSVYVFAELFFNGFGVGDLPANLAGLPGPLQRRLASGELFTLMRRYSALGGQIQAHPLASASVTVLSNLDDRSSLLNASLTFEPSDNQRLQAGIVYPLGGQGDEYGRIAVFPGVTRGGGRQLFARWVYYF